MTTFEARYHPELFRRFGEALEKSLSFEDLVSDPLDDIVLEVMALPLDGLVNFCAEIAFATGDRGRAVFRLGVLAGAISRLSK